MLSFQCVSDTLPVRSGFNVTAVLFESGKFVSLRDFTESQKATQLLLGSLGMLTLRKQPPPCCEEAQISLCRETIGGCSGRQPISTTRHMSKKKNPPDSSSEPEITTTLVFPAKAQTSHLYWPCLNSDRIHSIIKCLFYTTKFWSGLLCDKSEPEKTPFPT